jgi:hypothetical protein
VIVLVSIPLSSLHSPRHPFENNHPDRSSRSATEGRTTPEIDSHRKEHLTNVDMTTQEESVNGQTPTRPKSEGKRRRALLSAQMPEPRTPLHARQPSCFLLSIRPVQKLRDVEDPVVVEERDRDNRKGVVEEDSASSSASDRAIHGQLGAPCLCRYKRRLPCFDPFQQQPLNADDR